jgi:predicted nucleic acid-binding protein
VKVVADSSVMISLSNIGLLDLLRQRFPDGIMVPPAVWHEVVDLGRGRPGSDAVRATTWIQVVEPANETLIRDLKAGLDPGEAEAIALALEQQALLLLDEREGRRRATHLGLSVLGTIGILIWARREALIPSLAEALDACQKRGSFRISELLRRQVLEGVGEA